VHPLHAALIAAADGRFPPADGRVDVYPPDEAGFAACVEFAGHAVILTTADAADVAAHGADGFGGSSHPDLLRWLAGPTGTIGSHDVVLVARGAGGGTLRERTDFENHPRVRRARRHRRDVRVYANDDGLVTIGTGLVGRQELSVELFDMHRSVPGRGGILIGEALAMVPRGGLLWAQVAPGNASSLRAFLRCGFVPIGAEVLISTRID
jgi:hypothetical protein